MSADQSIDTVTFQCCPDCARYVAAIDNAATEIARLQAGWDQAFRIGVVAQERNKRLLAALRQIDDTPMSMVNDAESLRHTIKVIQEIARKATTVGASEGNK